MPIPSRQVIGRSSPKRIYEFGDKIHNKLKVDDAKRKEERGERSGKISGGKLGKPTLWAVLDLIGVEEELDPYLLGKFLRGHDVEDRAIEMLTGIRAADVKPGEPVKSEGDVILKGEFILQKEAGYRGGIGFVDLAQVIKSGDVYHEIKSSTKMAYDRVSASGRFLNKTQDSKGDPVGVPQYHHALQLAYYCIGDDVHRGFLHYFNADDYRLCTFAINPNDYKEEIDKEIDDIQLAFKTKQLPSFEAYLPWHKIKQYWSYKEWNELSPSEMMTKLRGQFPEQYKKFMEMEL